MLERRSFIPSITDVGLSLRTASGLVGEESEDFVLPDGTPDAAAELGKEVGVAQVLITLTIERLEGV